MDFKKACAERNDANCLRTCQLFEIEQGRRLFAKDRAAILDALAEHLTERFNKVLDDPVLQAMGIFDHRNWPSDSDILKDMYLDEIKVLYSTYKRFFESTDDETELLDQWEQVKLCINKEAGLKSRKFHDLWAHMLLHWSDEYALVLRLVAIALLVPVDTSECERVFSLLNDIKTAERNQLNQVNLTNLMLWHSMGKLIKCQDLDVMAILQVSGAILLHSKHASINFRNVSHAQQ